MIESLARNVATPVAARTLAKDASQPEDPISEDVVADYLNSLGRLFVIENQPAWQPHLRSRYRLRRSVKRHFVDCTSPRSGWASWGAFEVKLGGQKPVDEAAANLLKFRDRVDSSRTGPPAVLGVIVANGYGYVREDGAQVIPIASLGP